MSKTSFALSNIGRIHFTVNYTDGTAYFIDIDTQEKLLILTNEEVINLGKLFQECEILADVTPEK
jgi:hypothetical protein